MARWLYSLAHTLLVPALLLRWLWRSRREPDYRRRWGERFGRVSTAQPGGLWLHAVSVGELMAALPLLEALLARESVTPVVTTTTPAASMLRRERLGDRVFHTYLPLDLPWCVGAFLRRVQPRRLLLMEKELWPNLLAQAAAAECPVSVLNARMDSRAASRYRRLSSLFEPGMEAIDRVFAQSAADAANWEGLLDRDRTEVGGDMKLDRLPDPALRAAAQVLRQRIGERAVLVAASTHPGEELLLLQAWAALPEPRPLLVLAPRHISRANEIAGLVAQAGLALERRSISPAPAPDIPVFLLDSLGELPLFLGVAAVALAGGSFVPVGGHNLAEAAAWCVVQVAGPHLSRQAETARTLEETGALLRVEPDPASLALSLEGLLADSDGRKRRGAAGGDALRASAGASARVLEYLAGDYRVG